MNWLKNLFDPKKEDSPSVYYAVILMTILASTFLMFVLFLAEG